jgi:tRNA threonylcarbamoyladenosine biosynthesis protein TsaE
MVKAVARALLNLTIPTAEDMEQLGRRLAAAATAGRLLCLLSGELGCGKTTLFRGYLRGRGYTGVVKSPTYTIVEPYGLAAGTVYHFDLYRINDGNELEHMGLRDYFERDACIFVEWPERGFPPSVLADIGITMTYTASGREVLLTAWTEIGAAILNQIGHAAP